MVPPSSWFVFFVVVAVHEVIEAGVTHVYMHASKLPVSCGTPASMTSWSAATTKKTIQDDGGTMDGDEH